MNSVDPSGLCEHMLYDDASCFAGGFFGTSMTCIMDGVDTGCGQVFRFLDLGIAEPCPNNSCFGDTPGGGSIPPGITTLPGVGAIVTSGFCIDTSLPGYATSNCTITGINVLGAPQGDNSSWTFVKTFVNGVLHGDRQPGQSFAACVDQNIRDTTFGTVDPKALTNKGGWPRRKVLR